MIHSVPGRFRIFRAVGVGLAVALLSGCAAAASTTPLRDTPDLLIEGHGRAITSRPPPGETFTLTAKAPDVRSGPGESEDVHLQSGFVFPATLVEVHRVGFKLSPDGRKLGMTGGQLRMRCP